MFQRGANPTSVSMPTRSDPTRSSQGAILYQSGRLFYSSTQGRDPTIQFDGVRFYVDDWSSVGLPLLPG
jgi:hypothetical protein